MCFYWMRWAMRGVRVGVLIVAGACWCGALSAKGASAAESAAGPAREAAEDRLLRAELLEVSTGALDQAMAVYRAIQADDQTPEPVRARALLYLARCHRKLGELKTAEKLLNDLVQQHGRQREIVRQARSFLRELRRGEADNPEFDWLGQLERNPEIQARVFDLAMELVDPDRHYPAPESVWRVGRRMAASGEFTPPSELLPLYARRPEAVRLWEKRGKE